MKKTKASLLIATIATALLISCNVEDLTKTADPSTVEASMAIDAANSLDVQTGLEVANNNSSTAKNVNITSTCANITYPATTAYPQVITVDFGTGCTINQITRKGKLKITLSAPLTQTEAKMTIERIGYSVNNYALEGTIEYTNATVNAAVPKWTRKVTNGKITNTNGAVFTNSGTCAVQQTAGVDTPYVLADNVYEMTEGKHTTTDEKGNTVTLTVLATLVKKFSCDYISQGQLKIESGLLNGTIDFGSNDCDNNYTFTLKNGFVFNLTM